MMILPLAYLQVTALAMSSNVLPAALGLVLSLTASPSTTIPVATTSEVTQTILSSESHTTTIRPQTVENVPVLEILKVYGKLAGPNCYGKKAPPGSSCQIRLRDLEQAFSPLETDGSNANTAENPSSVISREEFASKLERMEFQWPLKPYGINEKSLTKTAIMNKGAETRVFMEELESREMYDPRNPAGPLPTSLRPALNRELEREGIRDARAIDLAYEALIGSGESKGMLRAEQTEYIDYYDFLKRIGPNSITWPK
ncbi:unnamed protein product [Pseudo-nitzschia multistriata]|uniref:Uncharacterized protein n=1 Tax=Pseudo-nitzschia multistriata TaxID=183589 RepID=A0A448YY59_9STRA|nr:unnamed protein product [Pseudo-nitzschia multistriata]